MGSPVANKAGENQDKLIDVIAFAKGFSPEPDYGSVWAGVRGRVSIEWSRRMAETSALFPSSRWVTYAAAAERLGLTPGLVAARALRRRWPTRIRGDTGEAEVAVPAALLDIDSIEIELEPDLPLRERVAQAVGHVDRREAAYAWEKAFAEERAIANGRAAAPKRPWWLGGWILK